MRARGRGTKKRERKSGLRDYSRLSRIVFILLGVAVIGLLAARLYTGYVSSHAGQAGYIHEMNIRHQCDSRWAGITGYATWAWESNITMYNFTMNRSQILAGDLYPFSCLEPGAINELYASFTTGINFSSLQPASPALADAYLGPPGLECGMLRNDTANNTFVHNLTLKVGDTTITNIPAVYTYQSGVSNSRVFPTGLLVDGNGNLVFVSVLTGTPRTSYSGDYINFQMMLPVNDTEQQLYYVQSDPFDVCPEGGEGGWGFIVPSSIWGVVRDNVTGLPLANVTVYIGNGTGITDANGTYNIVSNSGDYILIGIADGYHISIHYPVTIPSTEPGHFNFTMQPVTVWDISGQLGSVQGYVRDSSTGTLLENVTVSLTHVHNVTNDIGFYNLTNVMAGEHYIAAIKSGYFINVSLINITAGSITYHNISLAPYAEPGAGPGAGVGAGVGAGGAGGAGGTGTGIGAGVGPGITLILEELIGTEFYVSVRSIERKLTQGTFAETTVSFYNLADEDKTVSLAVEGDVAPYVGLDKTKLRVTNNGTGELLVKLVATGDVGTYTGNLVISGDGNASLPINLTILPREKLPIRALLMGLDLLRDVVAPGDILRYNVDLRNLLTDVEYDVSLRYSLQKEGTALETRLGEDEVRILTFLTLLNEYTVPEETEPGDYIFTVSAAYLNMTAMVSTPFKVALPVYKYAILGVLPVWLLGVIILALAIGTYGVMEYRQALLLKRRYVATVEYNLLPKEGPRSLFLGKIAESERKAWFDLDQLTTHAIVAGSTGAGKTTTAQVMVEELLAKDIAVLVFDPTAQWTGMLRKLQNPKMFSYYPQFGMKRGDAKAFNGNVRVVTNAREKIDLNKYIKPGEVQVFSLNKLDPKEMDMFVSNTVRTIFRANFPESPVLKVFFVYEEVHRLLPRFGGTGEGFVQIERACREFRKWGLGVMLISQVQSDFVGEIKANINTVIQMRTRDERDLERVKMTYGDELLKSIVKAEVGTCMMVNTSANRGNPYFISIRPIVHSIQKVSDEQLEQYNRYNGLIDDIEFQIEQLEAEGVDVFDLRLELKLALDKVKAGNFNMVEIYLEGLTPRVDEQWKKLGKSPKKRVIELVAEKELRGELKAALEERKRLKAEEEEAEAPKEEKVLKLKKLTRKFLTFNSGVAVSTMEEMRDALSSMDDSIFSEHVNAEKHDIADWIRDHLELPEDAEAFRKLMTRTGVLEHLKEIEGAKEEVVLTPKPSPVAAPAPAAAPEPTAVAPAEPLVGKPPERPPEKQPPAADPLQEIERKIAEMQDLLRQVKHREAYEIHKEINALYQALPQDVKVKVYAKFRELYRKLKEFK